MVLFFALRLGLSALGLLLCPLHMLKALVNADPFTDHHGEGSHQGRLSKKSSFTLAGFFTSPPSPVAEFTP